MPLWTFLRPTALTRAGRQVRMLAAGLGRDDFASEIERAHALSALILDRLPWRTGVTDADTTAEKAVGGEGGGCPDHAHILLDQMRHLGHPAPPGSGYSIVGSEE